MIDGKWHLRKLHGRWQCCLKQGNALKIRWLPVPPAVVLRMPAQKQGARHD